MRLSIDTTGKRFIITRKPEPKVDQNGVQRVDKGAQLPMWTTQMVAIDQEGGEVITVTTTAHEAPDLVVDDEVRPVELVAIPWSTNGRAGVAYKAAGIYPIEDGDE